MTNHIDPPKIDRRRTYIMMVDTETANTFRDECGDLCTDYALPYDVGYAIIDTHGTIYHAHSFVNTDIYDGMSDIMTSAYYADKIPLYEEDLALGLREKANTYTIRAEMLRDFALFDCVAVCAHNARFDFTALNNLQRWTTKSKYRYWFPYGTEVWDSLKMARSVVAKMPTYQRYCTENDYLTKQGKPRLTAEILYRFISRDPNFIEAHTGFEDVRIEAQILAYCYRQHKKMQKKLFEKV